MIMKYRSKEYVSVKSEGVIIPYLIVPLTKSKSSLSAYGGQHRTQTPWLKNPAGGTAKKIEYKILSYMFEENLGNVIGGAMFCK